MFEPVKISPSILSANFMHMERSIREIEEGGASFVHVDVMDGHFVPNISMGIPVVKQLKKATELPLDVHLMVANPLDQIPWFLDAGADILTIHLEALDLAQNEAEQAIEMIRAGGARPSLSLKPDTPVSALQPYISELYMVLIMSVYPGFSGQSYIQGSEERIADVVRYASEAAANPLIEIDGGIDPSTLERVVLAGADVLVAGNAIFGTDDPIQATKNMIALAESTRSHS